MAAQVGPRLDPATVPQQPLSELVQRAEGALDNRLSEDKLGRVVDILAGMGWAGKWEPQAQELRHLQQAVKDGQDTPQLRQRARSLLSSLGIQVEGTPENLKPDSGDTFAQTTSLGDEIAQQAAELAAAAKKRADELVSPVWPWLVGGALVVLATGAGVYAAVSANRRADEREREAEAERRRRGR